MAVSITLLPTRYISDDELIDACFYLQRLGIDAWIGHRGPNGSIEIGGTPATEETMQQAERFIARLSSPTSSVTVEP